LPEPNEQRAVPRAFWSGTITFGLVSIPVDLFAAVHGRDTSMKMVDEKGRPLGRQYYSEDDRKLTDEHIVRGYETDSGEMVVITDAELDAAAPELSRDIELKRFVPLAYFQRPYFLVPSGRSTKAYHLLAETMKRAGRVGIGSFVMRGHEYLVAIISDGGVLRAETVHFADELRSPEDMGLPKRAKVPAKETLIKSRTVRCVRGGWMQVEKGSFINGRCSGGFRSRCGRVFINSLCWVQRDDPKCLLIDPRSVVL
jgi:DNA end-binding protein Ku